MRVLLAYPFRENTYQKIGFILPPMGIGYIASTLRDAGHAVDIVDFNIRKHEKIDFGKYDVVGISMDTSRFKSGLSIAKKAKANGCMVVAGGPHVSFMDKEALATGIVDYVVRGEGELTFVELLNTIESRGVGTGVNPVKMSPFNGVKGISYTNNGKLVRTEDRGFINNIDDFIPARDLLDLQSYRSLEMGKRKITPILTSRGCPFGCSFCSSSEMSGRRWRARSAAKVITEIEEIVKGYKFNGIAFLDDNFTMNPQRVVDICDGILHKGINIYWWCFSRTDTLLKNETMVKKMSEAGCKYIFIGFESSHQRTLDNYGKTISEKTYKDVVALLRKYKIAIHGSFIIGGLDETKEMIMDTIRYACELNPEAVQFSILTPYPGTRLFEGVKDRILTYDWDLYDCLHSVIKLNHMGQDEIHSLLKKAYMDFYLSPQKLIAGLLSGLRGKGIKLSSIMKIMRGVW